MLSFTIILAEISFSFSIGPALNLATKNSDFYIGPFIVNNYRSPGVKIYFSL